MSNHLSPAQVLPIDILRSIIRWVVLERTSSLHGNRFQLQYLEKLLTVSSAWRQVSLETLWRKLNLVIDSSTNDVRLKRPTWCKDNALPHDAANLAREIRVSFSLSSIVSGAAHKLLADYIGDTKCFPLANVLTVDRTDFGSLLVSNKAIAISNVYEFARLLKSMAPAATTADVICTSVGFPTHTVDSASRVMDEEFVTIMADILYANTNQAHLGLNSVEIHNPTTINVIQPLSRLVILNNKTPDMCASLLHKSASTLQYLDIGMCKLNPLILATKGEDVVYPKLQYLTLLGISCNDSNATQMSSDSVPFPVLRVVKLMPYPFHDDAVFRGNAATLEYVDFSLDKPTLTMLNEKQVFKGEHKVLRQVKIGMSNGHMNTNNVTEVDTSKLLNNLLSAAKRLSVMSPKTDIPLIAAAAQHDQGFENITVFETFQGRIFLSDALTVLKALPALVELRSTIIGSGPELDYISTRELPDHVVSTHRDVGTNLQVLSLNPFATWLPIAKMDYLFPLTLVCPNLRRIEISPGSIQDYQAMIAYALNRQLKYAQQLNRISDILCEESGTGM